MKYLLGGITLLLIPIILAFCMHFKIFSYALGDANGWLGYWGGYLGALIGAATVYILTQKQLKIQEKLHQDALTAQLKLHEENLVHQKNLQMENIKLTSAMEDKRQRDLIIANLRIEKIDKLVVEIINLNGLLSERFNILRNYVNFYDKRKKLFKKTLNEGRRRGFIEKYKILIYKGDSFPNSSFKKVSKRSLLNIRRGQLKFQSNIDLINEYQKKKNDLLDQETIVRNKIILSSAIIKSESMFADLDDSLNPFREKLTEVLEFFYDLIEQDMLVKDIFLRDINDSQEELMTFSNQSIAICKEKLDEELNSLKTNQVA